jgi:hypothetical protein
MEQRQTGAAAVVVNWEMEVLVAARQGEVRPKEGKAALVVQIQAQEQCRRMVGPITEPQAALQVV